ncbi:MAG: LysM peptidoglycan-binding domain-containing protein [bacterium]|nr:LysM peptidoglycan-binding domain-containing protein [bacterium]
MTIIITNCYKPASIPKRLMMFFLSLALVTLGLSSAGCSSFKSNNNSGETESPSPKDDFIVTGQKSTSYSDAQLDSTLGDLELLIPPESETTALLPIGPDGYAKLEDLEHLLTTTLGLLADDNQALAQDHLFVLEEQLNSSLPAGVDSLYTAHRLSLQRRTWYLDGVLAEMVSFSGNPAFSDSLLATQYGRLTNHSFPDSLVPATGITLPAFTADLLKVDNQAVNKWVSYFSGRGHRNFQIWLDRKASRDSLVSAILVENELPKELIYLAIIESGLGSHAVSSAGAVGPWQFMPATGKSYDLKQSWWIDERRDLEMSTRAAAKHLKSLHKRFDDWALVLAAYNSGGNRVARRIRMHGHDNFWDMRLPSQTTAYVPKFIAAARIGQSPEKYGFKTNTPVVYQYDVVKVRDATDLQLMARCAGVPAHEVVQLNPSLLRDASPPGFKGYPIRVPKGTGPKATTALSKIPLDKRLTWRRHKIQRGENLGQIARKYGTSVGDISKLNKLQNVHLIRPGDQLLIPMPAQLSQIASKRADEKGHYVPPSGYKRVSYKVKSGDNLGKIGKKLGVTVAHLRKVNGLYKTNLIYPGQKIYAYRP